MKNSNTPAQALKINRLTVRSGVRAGEEETTRPMSGGTRPITVGYTWRCY